MARFGDTLVAGAPGYDHEDEHSGAVWVYSRSAEGWKTQTVLVAEQPVANEYFGAVVAMDGDTIAVGTFSYVHQHSVYVYHRRDGVWEFAQKLTTSAPYGNSFGASLAITGNMILVGEPEGRPQWPGLDAGAVYVFHRLDGVWHEGQVLHPDDASWGDGFGRSLAVHGSTLIVGAPWQDPDPSYGGAYVFDLIDGEWIQTHKLRSEDPSIASEFGAAVSTDGENLVVGAPRFGTREDNRTGAAHVFRLVDGLWTEQGILIPAGAKHESKIGEAVAISGNRVVVGAPRHEVGGLPFSGAAYVFNRIGDQWEEQLLTMEDPVAEDVFGYALALDGDSLLVTAPGGTTVWGEQSGSIHLFDPTTESVDLEISVSGGQNAVILGDFAEYTISVSNPTVADVNHARIISTIPGEFLEESIAWSCSATGGATCTLPSGGRWLNDPVDLPAGSSLEITGTCQSKSDLPHQDEIGFAAAILPPPGMADRDTTDNEAFTVDPIRYEVDLVVSKSNGREEILEGQLTSYAIIVANRGPSRAARARVVDSIPDELSDCQWTCTRESPGSVCESSVGRGDIDTSVWIDPGAAVYFALTCTAGEAGTVCTNETRVTPREGVIDRDPTNNVAVDEDLIIAVPSGGLVRNTPNRLQP